VKAESQQWKKLRPILQAARLDPVRVENPIHPGTPDVNLTTGWIELKTIACWPMRATSKVRIPHYTPQQRVFLYRRWKYAPGTTFLLMEVRADRQWLLFDGDVAARIVGRGTASDHRREARAVLAEHDLAELPRILAEPKVLVQDCPSSERKAS
jgi:Mesyanzhinovviridae DNA helicase